MKKWDPSKKADIFSGFSTSNKAHFLFYISWYHCRFFVIIIMNSELSDDEIIIALFFNKDLEKIHISKKYVKSWVFYSFLKGNYFNLL